MASKEHQALANIIKNVHVELRLKSRLDGAEKAWVEHVKHTDQLQTYATAMRKLATEHWDKNNMSDVSLCRIQWVIDRCYNYFKNGGLNVHVDKEIRLHRKYFGTESYHFDQNSCSPIIENDKLVLLDVGSCYNPFKICDYFYTVPIDLIPATDDVIKCDFLNVIVSPNMEVCDIENPCNSLPERRFDIVVFSLLLEYFPSSKQRWMCCNKAYDLLKVNGILIILTPDSKHATANSKIIKNWRYVLADIGFLLVSYEKLKHLHCLVYRKCIDINVPKHWLLLQKKAENNCSLDVSDMICIPQDFHDYKETCSNHSEVNVNSDSDYQFTADCFTELPDVNIFS